MDIDKISPIVTQKSSAIAIREKSSNIVNLIPKNPKFDDCLELYLSVGVLPDGSKDMRYLKGGITTRENLDIRMQESIGCADPYIDRYIIFHAKWLDSDKILEPLFFAPIDSWRICRTATGKQKEVFLNPPGGFPGIYCWLVERYITMFGFLNRTILESAGLETKYKCLSAIAYNCLDDDEKEELAKLTHDYERIQHSVGFRWIEATNLFYENLKFFDRYIDLFHYGVINSQQVSETYNKLYDGSRFREYAPGKYAYRVDLYFYEWSRRKPRGFISGHDALAELFGSKPN